MSRTSLLAMGAIVALVTATGASMAQQERGAPAPAEKMSPSGAKPPAAVQHQGGQTQNMPAGRNEKMNGRVGEIQQNRGRPETTGQAPREDQQTRPNERNSEPRRGETERNSERRGETGHGPRSERNGPPLTTGQAPREDREESRATTGQGAAGARANINLTQEKRAQIHETIIQERNAPRVSNVDFNISIGARVPRSVRFAALPRRILEIEPAWRGFEYFMIGDEIVIVDPRTLAIVAIVEA